MDTGKQKNIQKNVLKIMKTLESEGFQCYLVGGAVRDILMNEEPKDWDIATDAVWYETQKIFPGSEVVSENMSVVKIFLRENGGYTETDVATFREEHYTEHSGKPDRVRFLRNINDDLKRRDFTINAMAMDTEGNITDLYGGMADIKSGTLRFVGDGRFRLTEDPVRMLRGIRMIAEKNFEPEIRTKEAIYETAELVKFVGGERAGAELLGIAKGKYRKKAYGLLVDTGILETIFEVKLSSEKRRIIIEKINNAEKQKQALQLNNACDFPVEKISLAVFLTGVLKQAGCRPDKFREKINEMSFDKEFSKELTETFEHIEELSGTDKRKNLKNFINRTGEKEYLFTEKVIENDYLLYDSEAVKLSGEKRRRMYSEIKNNREAVFIKDLDINGRILKDKVNIKGREIGETLDYLLLKVQENNNLNKENILTDLAERRKRNKQEQYNGDKKNEDRED